MTYLRTSEKFERKLDKSDKSICLQVGKIIDKIMINPELGKPMRYDRRGTREVYVGSFRLAYFYDRAIDTIFLLDLYHKDEQ